MNETNKTLSETISEHLTESSEVYKQNELPPVELKATIPGLIDQKIELAHLYSEFRLSEQRVSNGIMNEMEPGARYIRDLNVRKIAIIREKFDSKFKDLLGVEDISELNDLDEAFAVLEEAGAAHFEEVEQIDEMRVKVGPEQYHKGTDTVWHVVHHNGKEIGTVGTNAKEHHEKHGKWGFEDSRGWGRKDSQPKLNSKEQAVRALTDRHKEYVAKETNEEVEQIGEAFVIHKGKHAAGETSSLAGQTHYGVEIKDVYADKKEAQAHADKLNQGRGYKPEDQKNPAVASALYQVSPKNTKRVPGVPLNAVFKINEKAPPGMEDWVKGRKEDFKERYGDRWEEVLYRTAWKMYNKKEEAKQVDESKKSTHTVRLEYGPTAYEYDRYKVSAKHDSDAIEQAIQQHRMLKPYHSESMLKGNAYIENRRGEEVKQVDEASFKQTMKKLGRNLNAFLPTDLERYADSERAYGRAVQAANALKGRSAKKGKNKFGNDELETPKAPVGAYFNHAERLDRLSRGKNPFQKEKKVDGDSESDVPERIKLLTIKVRRRDANEEVEQIDEIKLNTAIRALHSMKDKGASPENTKRVNRMSNAIARKWGEKGAAVADKAVSDIDAKQASSGSRDKYFAGDVLGRWRLRRHAADAEKAKLSDNRRIKTPNLPEEVEQIDEESAHLTVTKLKSDGKHEEAGAAAFKHGLGRKYGPHFGLRSTKDKDEAAFHLGYDKAEMQSRKKVDEEVEQISGSVLSKLRAARAK